MHVTRLSRSFAHHAPSLHANAPLSDQQILSVAPSIFATQAHASRSERYTYIQTIKVLDGLRKQGFEAFFVCQTRVRDEAKRDHTKHMLRLRHASQIDTENANEIILLVRREVA